MHHERCRDGRFRELASLVEQEKYSGFLLLSLFFLSFLSYFLFLFELERPCSLLRDFSIPSSRWGEGGRGARVVMRGQSIGGG